MSAAEHPPSSSDARELLFGSVCGFVAFCVSVGSAWGSMAELAHQSGIGVEFVDGSWFGPVALLGGIVPIYLFQIRARRRSLSFAAGIAATATICSFLFFAFWILVH